MEPSWRVELHAHSCWSLDSLTQPETIVQLCQERKITRIAITDHNTADGALALKRLAPELTIVGEEIMTTHGELLAWFIQESVPPGLSPDETIRRLREQGAIISVSHPFDRYRRGAWRQQDLERIVEAVDAIEVYNSRCLRERDNEQALQFARRHGLPGSVGSDAHSTVEYGRSLQLMRPFDDDPADFLDALRSSGQLCRSAPALVHFSSTAAKWVRRLGLRRRG